jgi:hypothetical protein
MEKEKIEDHIENGFNNCTNRELFYFLNILIHNQTRDEIINHQTKHKNFIGLSAGHASRCTRIYADYVNGIIVMGNVIKGNISFQDRDFLIITLPRYRRQFRE